MIASATSITAQKSNISDRLQSDLGTMAFRGIVVLINLNFYPFAY